MQFFGLTLQNEGSARMGWTSKIVNLTCANWQPNIGEVWILSTRAMPPKSAGFEVSRNSEPPLEELEAIVTVTLMSSQAA